MTGPLAPPSEPEPAPTAPTATTPVPKSSGDQLGNILIGSALIMAVALALGVLFVATRDDDGRFVHIDRDAELEFVRERDRRDPALLTYVEEPYDECEDNTDDSDAESRFADGVPCDPVGGGLFPDETRNRDLDGTIDFRAIERPTLRVDLADRGTSRLREVSISLGRGRGDIDFAIRNPTRVDLDSEGIAVRTTSDAALLSNTRFVTIRRPDDCARGCDLTVWLTMGKWFQEDHPDAELMLYAGDNADASIEEISRLPRQVYR